MRDPAGATNPFYGMSKQSLTSIGFLLLVSALSGCASKSGPAAAGPSTSEPEVAGFVVETAPVPPPATSTPLEGATLWVDADSQAAHRSRAIETSNPEGAALLQRIAEQPQALWLGEWSGDVGSTVADTMRRAGGTLPVFVLYNLPYRDCGSHSAGGVETETAYRTWVRRVRSGIAGRPAVTILEPDALGLLDRCLSEEQQESRLALMTDAVNVLRQDADTAVYVDAGHSRWVAADVMADRLRRAGVRNAHGFALNTSNYGTTEENVAYGERLSALLGGAHFVIDTSRNGVGPTPDGAWCNPPGRKLGAPPTTETGNDLVDAWLWLKRPGESDGECNGGPRAGMFWDAQAFELAE